MDIRQVSEEEKRECIDNIKIHFSDLRKMLSMLEVDMESKELQIQASSVWISGQLCAWYGDFMTQIRAIDQLSKTQQSIEQELKDAENDNTIN